MYLINGDTALVQTLDFFTPITDDPFLFGQIAAANSLSDVYAMGGRPITAMAIAGMPSDKISLDTIQQIFAGGADIVHKAKCSVIGGHTIKNPQPIYGLSVTGTIHPQRVAANAHAQVGDLLVLTKPIGTGIIATAAKAGAVTQDLEQLSLNSMIALNTPGADLAEQDLVHACTDVTGFGLLGHLMEICRSSKTSAKLDASAIPTLTPNTMQLIADGFVPGGTKKNLFSVNAYLETAPELTDDLLYLLADAQTSGGLLLSVAPAKLDACLDVLEAHDTLCAAVIGEITQLSGHHPSIEIS